ncbi:MAG: YcaO-like family protein [Geminicoccaceae bacterium]|nr:YcaO-like family protein [Geminicoccaceae bacterium]
MRPWIEARLSGWVEPEGGGRLRPAGATLALVRPHVASMGITRLADITGLDRVGVSVVMAVRPEARAVAVSLGKGLSLDAARAGALMESLETWHAERIGLPLRLASLAELEAAGEDVLDVERLAKAAPLPFPRERRLLWVRGDDAAGTGHPWLPFEAVHTDYAEGGPPASGVLRMTSNGLASGNHPLEALEAALLEVVERDATRRFEALGPDGRKARCLDLDGVAAPGCRELLARIGAAGLPVRAFDLTAPRGTPAVMALVGSAPGEDVPPCQGQAARADPADALQGALLEALQTRLTFIAGARDDLERDSYGREAVVEAVRRAAPLLGARPCRPLPPGPEPAPLPARLEALIAGLEAAECLRVGVVELPALVPGVAVLRVLVPGLGMTGGG